MPFQLEGHARAIANMSIGQITLDPIKFNVTSGLDGLQGLKGQVDIGTVDVLGGSSGAIHLGIPGACLACLCCGLQLGLFGPARAGWD